MTTKNKVYFARDEYLGFIDCFSTRAKAEEFFKKNAADHLCVYGDIEELKLDPIYRKIKGTRELVSVVEITIKGRDEVFHQPQPAYCQYKGFMQFRFRPGRIEWCFEKGKYTEDEQKKIITKKAYEIKAEGLWGNSDACEKIYRTYFKEGKQ